MKAIPIHEAKANLSKYIQQAKAGEPVYIGARGEAEVIMTVIPKPKPGTSIWGCMRGEIFLDGIDTDLDKLDEEILQDFEDSEIFPSAH